MLAPIHATAVEMFGVAAGFSRRSETSTNLAGQISSSGQR